MRRSPLLAAILLLAACGGSDATDSSTSSGTTASPEPEVPDECTSAASHVERVVCAAEAFQATLSDSERDTLLYDFTDTKARTTWSNFPTGFVKRNGLRLGDLDADSLAAAYGVASTLLSAAGYTDFRGILAADDYLNSQGGGSDYSSGNYYIAFIGTPSATSDWMLQIGGHHLGFNVTYTAGVGRPTPYHIAAEPKASFTIGGETWEPLGDKSRALIAVFTGLDDGLLADAYLDGQMFMDVLVGPDNGSGSLPNDYPTGDNRTGVLVSDLSADQQAAVTAAIEQYVADYDPEIADRLMTLYTGAYDDTYIAWGGTESAGVDPDVEGTYMRIDGPRMWLEVACPGGIVIKGATHYHTIFRDKTMDYGGNL